jgi:hypothetical protein
VHVCVSVAGGRQEAEEASKAAQQLASMGASKAGEARAIMYAVLQDTAEILGLHG